MCNLKCFLTSVGSFLPMMSQVVEAAFDEAHSDLSVSEPTDQRTEQLLCFINQTLRQMYLKKQARNSKLNNRVTWKLRGTKIQCCCMSSFDQAY